jgi:LAGLIDADG DNA endonuclease family protein
MIFGKVGNTLQDVDAAWLAGLVDGEGHIRLDDPNKTGRLYLRICLVNTNYELLERVNEVVGAGTIHTRKKGQEHHKDSWAWQIGGKAAEQVLGQILPWLIVKREKAVEALTYYSSLDFRVSPVEI